MENKKRPGRPRRAIPDTRTPAEIRADRAKKRNDRAAEVLARLGLLPDRARIRQPVIELLLSISTPTFFRWVAAGKIPAPHREGRSTFWLAADVRKLLEATP